MSNITTANEQVSIYEVFRLLDVYAGPGKNYCPFGAVTHADGGLAPALRLYPDTNSAYCFACGEAFRPVSLLAKARDISNEEAALTLLEQAGYVPENIDDKLAALLADDTPAVDADSLAAALSTYCLRVNPEWKILQFDDEVAVPYRQCLDLLPLVTTPEAAQQWLKATKIKMASTLLRGNHEEADGDGSPQAPRVHQHH